LGLVVIYISGNKRINSIRSLHSILTVETNFPYEEQDIYNDTRIAIIFERETAIVSEPIGKNSSPPYTKNFWVA
jgi:hypothetical protein